MKGVIDRTSLAAAESVLRGLAHAVSELRIYTAEHPRFRVAVRETVRGIEDFFERHSGLRTIVFTFPGPHVEFQRVPLLNAGEASEALGRVVHDQGIEALQLFHGATEVDIEKLACTLHAWSRGRTVTEQDASGSPGSEGRFRFYDEIPRDHLVSLDVEGDDLETELRSRSVDDGLLIPELEVSESTFRSVVTTYRTLLSNLERGQELDYAALFDATDRVVSLFADGLGESTSLAVPRYFDDFTFHHSVNVSVIVTSLAAAITDDREVVRRLSLAALLHDVGKSRVPAEILHKPGRLTDAEFERLKEHPVDGAEILLGIPSIDPLCIAVAFTHHMSTGAESYPRSRRRFPCTWLTELVAVVDIYEALVAVRPYKRGMSSQRAFEIMLEMPGLRDRRHLIKLLSDRIGPYPTGTFVELSTGERAIVVGQNHGALDRPRVRVLTDAKRERLPLPLALDLATTLERHGAPLAIAATIVTTSADANAIEADRTQDPIEILGCPPTDDAELMRREG